MSILPIHRPEWCETVICLCGRIDEVFFNDNGVEIERIHLYPAEAKYECKAPKGVWHTVEVFESTIIFEAKDGTCGYYERVIFEDYN